jgi:hypothetical protein
LAFREVTFYSDAAGTDPMYSSHINVSSLTATQTNTLCTVNHGCDFGANKCIDQDISSNEDGFICHTDDGRGLASISFTATLVADIPPASFRIYYRFGADYRTGAQFKPTEATLTGGGISFLATQFSEPDNTLFVL